MNNQRSPFTLSIIEILAIILAIIIAEVGFYYGLQSTTPYFPHIDPNTPWMVTSRQKLFSTFALPLGIVLLIPTVSLVRSIRKDVRHFSRLGHLASAWPLLASATIWRGDLIFLGAMCGMFLLVIGIGPITAILVGLKALLSKHNRGDLLAIPVNAAWSIFYWIYLVNWGKAFIF